MVLPTNTLSYCTCIWLLYVVDSKEKCVLISLWAKHRYEESGIFISLDRRVESQNL